MSDNALLNELDSFYPTMAEEPVEDGQPEPVEDEESVEEDGSEAEEAEESEAETEDTEDGEGGEPEYEVIVDGKTEKVNKTELIKGYQRQADYTRKTQALAKTNEEVKAEKAKLSESLESLSAIESELEQLVMGDLSNINWNELRDTDPSEYLRMKEVVEARKGTLKQLSEKRKALEADQASKEQLALHKALGWDAEDGTAKREADIKLLNDQFGNSPALARAKDADTVIAFIEAAKYRQLQKQKAEVKKELRKVPKTNKSVKPSKKADESNWIDSFYK